MYGSLNRRMFKDFLTMFMQQQSGRIWVSPSSSYGIVSSIPEERRLQEESPIQLRKAVKNSVEIEGMKKAHVSPVCLRSQLCCNLLSPLTPINELTEPTGHDLDRFDPIRHDLNRLELGVLLQIRDAVALVEFLNWMEKEVPKGGVTEMSAAEKLESFRRQQTDFVGLSFATISASGPNAAVIHYKPSRDTDR